MDAASKERLRYRFGAYEVSPDSLEFRKNGIRIRLREQVFRILVLMLERPGELITREELRRDLWPDDTFVDFDKSLNTAVNTLRDVLNDSAANPGFVETIPRHGYRFIADVQKISGLSDKLSSNETNSVAPTEITIGALQIAPKDSATRSVPGLFWTTLGFLIAGALAWSGYRTFRPTSNAETLRAVPLTSYAGVVRSPSLSPDGSQVAFSWQREGGSETDIYVQTVGAPEPRRLTDSPRDEFGPAWSPDGSAIAFLKGASVSNFDVMLVAPSGGEPRKITQIYYPLGYRVYQEELLTWMPDGKSLLFPDAAGTERTAIWSVDVHTGMRTQLTDPEPPVIGHSLPSVRSDGRVLVYQQVGGPYFFSLVVVRLSEEGKPIGNVKLIADGYNIAPIGWLGNDLVFSSRSKEPSFFNRWSPAGKISKFEIPDIDGMSARIGSVSGSITPDGRRMVIGIFRWNVHIWQADILPDGTGAHPRKFISSTFRDLNPDYSPDGRRIVFKSTRSGADNAWIAMADGTRLRQLTHIGSVGYPRWSPDGGRIVFNASPNARGNLFTADSETGDVHQITHGKSSDLNGHWSHDGRWIYFDSDRTGRSEIWKVSSDGGPEIQVTRTGGSNPIESPDGKYLYFAKEEARKLYVWRMLLASGADERLFSSQIAADNLALGTRRLYFVSSPSSIPKFPTVIYSYDLSTGRIHKVVEGGIVINYPAPSPDDKHLLYAVCDGAGGDLLVVSGLQKR
jgi:Tol biopolymer transport system component/DNA-binding winged helix-turn-helix (wHTH) protein